MALAAASARTENPGFPGGMRNKGNVAGPWQLGWEVPYDTRRRPSFVTRTVFMLEGVQCRAHAIAASFCTTEMGSKLHSTPSLLAV